MMLMMTNYITNHKNCSHNPRSEQNYILRLYPRVQVYCIMLMMTFYITNHKNWLCFFLTTLGLDKIISHITLMNNRMEIYSIMLTSLTTKIDHIFLIILGLNKMRSQSSLCVCVVVLSVVLV